MKKKVIIIGASGHGKVIADMIEKSGDRVEGFLDDNTRLQDSFIGYPLLGPVNQYKNYIDREFIIAIGDVHIREMVADRLIDVTWHTAIHPSAVISDIGVAIGEGTVVMANAVINSDGKIGRHCIVNTGAIVEHDNVLEDFVHVSVGAKLSGTVHVGKRTWIGAGATIKNNLSICGDCIIGAGAVVVKNIENVGTYIGVPAEKGNLMDITKFEGGGG